MDCNSHRSSFCWCFFCFVCFLFICKISRLIAIPQIQSSNIEAVIQQATLAQDGDSIAAATAGAIALGRVYTATSLPSHIWSLNGKFISWALDYIIWTRCCTDRCTSICWLLIGCVCDGLFFQYLCVCFNGT